MVMIILSTAWITSEIAKNSTAPAREIAFMDSYANAAVATFESGKHSALKQWLLSIGLSQHMTLYLINQQGVIFSEAETPNIIKKIAGEFKQSKLKPGIIKLGNIIISHDIISHQNTHYRLIAITEKPLSHFIQISLSGLAIRLIVTTIISGILCYYLSMFLTNPLRELTKAAKELGTGALSTRVGSFKGHANDEIAALSHEFDSMATELEKIISSKERLLHDISHELRSPLARLQISIALARKKLPSDKQVVLDRMELECDRLNTLIGEILDFARFKKDAVQIVFIPTDINLLLQSLTHDANYEFGQGKARVIYKGEELTQSVDPTLLHRATENILRNALRYSPENEVVTIELTHDESYFYIHIYDKGAGVPESQIEKIFNAFYRVDTAREKKTGGFGLGLSIAKEAIRLHGGAITARNIVNKGFLVKISIPAKFQ